MKQIARNLTDGLDGFLTGYKYLIHDRASHFSKSYRMILRAPGVKPVRLPRRSPNLNAYAERWVRTARALCLDKMILLGEHALRKTISELEIYYNREGPHQGIGNKIILPNVQESEGGEAIVCRSRLGGLLNYYYRKAA